MPTDHEQDEPSGWFATNLAWVKNVAVSAVTEAWEFSRAFRRAVRHRLPIIYPTQTEYSVHGNEADIPEDERIHYVMVHGYGDTPPAFEKITEYLKEHHDALPDKLTTIHHIGFANIFTHIEDFSLQLRQYIIENVPSGKVVLVGHSQGGIVCAHFTENYARMDGQEKQIEVPVVITLGSPFFGVRYAEYAPGKNATQMTRGSEFLRVLREKVASSGRTRYFFGRALHDKIVPCASSRLAFSDEDENVIDCGGHMKLLNDESTKAFILDSTRKGLQRRVQRQRRHSVVLQYDATKERWKTLAGQDVEPGKPAATSGQAKKRGKRLSF